MRRTSTSRRSSRADASEARSVRCRIHPHGAFDPGELRARHPHAARHGLHTGDWKIDPEPGLGLPTDSARLTAIGDEGVLALVCDSTNILRDGVSPSEAEVALALQEVDRRRAAHVSSSRPSPPMSRVSAPWPGGQGGRPQGRAARPRDGARRQCRARERLSSKASIRFCSGEAFRRSGERRSSSLRQEARAKPRARWRASRSTIIRSPNCRRATW